MQPTTNTSSEDDEIGRRLRLARLNRGWSLEEVCEGLGGTIAAVTLADYETGRRPIAAADLKRLARVLNLPPAFFLQDDSLVDWRGSWRLLELFESLTPSQQARLLELMDEVAADVAVSVR